jgi:patatin-like phospholipase
MADLNGQAGSPTAKPRRLLALDGGGIRGVMSLEILRRIEQDLATATGKGASFRLGDFFDYIGGTSTGAIIAAGLAMGKSVQELVDFYVEAGPLMFEKTWLLGRLRSFYQADPLRKKLNEVFGDRTLGAEDLRSLLLIVTRNTTTDSPWPVSSNPLARYNDRNRADCNLQIPLWQLVRASTAAPVYFPPEIVEWDKDDPAKTFFFMDGGMTSYNNPAFLLFRMATLPQYRLNWPTGEDRMMLISIGTGAAAAVSRDLNVRGQLAPINAAHLPGVLMGGAAIDQDINCRAIGRCVFGEQIDREIGDMIPRQGDPLKGSAVPLEKDCGRQFLYARYNPDVSRDGLDALGLNKIDPDHVQALDQIQYISEMQSVGREYAARFVDMTPFQRFVNQG